MGAFGLLFVGAVLFVNAVMLLGRVDPRSGAVFNLFVRALQTFVPIYLIARARTPDDVFLGIGAAVVFAALAVMTVQRPRMAAATPSGPAGDLTAGQPR